MIKAKRSVDRSVFVFCGVFHYKNTLKPLIGAAFDFDYKKACIALDRGKVNGKIVVEV